MSDQCAFCSEELAHTADIGLRMWAPDGATLFAGAARAMFGLIYETLAAPPTEEGHQVSLVASDPETLLIDWLNELLFLFEVDGLAYTEALMDRWEPTQMAATVRGQRPTEPPIVHIKAATYHQIRVRPVADGWEAQVFFDI